MIFDISKRRPGWSLSRIQSFACPLLFARLNIERRAHEEASGDAACIGKIVAGTMEVLRERYLKGESVISYTEIAQKVAVKEGGDEDILKEALKSLENGFTRLPDLFPKRDNVQWWAVELRLAFDADWVPQILSGDDWTLENGGEAHFRMVLDAAWIDRAGVLHIEDDKALFGKPDPFQLKSYTFGLCTWLGWEMGGRKPDLKPFKPSMIKVRFNMLGKGRYEHEKMYTFDEVSDVPAKFREMIAPILATRDFVPIVFKDHCETRCGFVSECPKHQSVATDIEASAAPVPTFALPGRIVTKEEAEKLGVFLLCAQTILSDGRKLMQEFVKANGDTEIPGTGKVYRFNTESAWEANLSIVIKEFIAQGYETGEIFEHMGASWRRVDKVIKKLTPLSGPKGTITKEIKLINKSRRAELNEILKGVGEDKPRRPKFGAYNQ